MYEENDCGLDGEAKVTVVNFIKNLTRKPQNRTSRDGKRKATP